MYYGETHCLGQVLDPLLIFTLAMHVSFCTTAWRVDLALFHILWQGCTIYHLFVHHTHLGHWHRNFKLFPTSGVLRKVTDGPMRVLGVNFSLPCIVFKGNSLHLLMSLGLLDLLLDLLLDCTLHVQWTLAKYWHDRTSLS